MLELTAQPGRDALAGRVIAHRRSPEAQIMTLEQTGQGWFRRGTQGGQGRDSVAHVGACLDPHDGVGLTDQAARQHEDSGGVGRLGRMRFVERPLVRPRRLRGDVPMGERRGVVRGNTEHRSQQVQGRYDRDRNTGAVDDKQVMHIGKRQQSRRILDEG